MTAASIVLVPGFWLGAWAWDEGAAILRADGYDVTALTLPGLESPGADRSPIRLADHVEAICAAVETAPAPVVLAVHSGAGGAGYADGPYPRTDRRDGLRRLRSGNRRDGPGSRRRRPPDAEPRGARRGGEPRRSERGAARDVPRARRRGTGRGTPRRARAHQQSPPGRADDVDLHRLLLRAGEGGGRRRLRVARWVHRAAQRDMDRPADEPLADVVTAA